MGSPIDPVTGLPMVGVPDVVSQIPLGKQVVPFSDMAATDRPQVGPAYPNDILNTLAWVTGEDVSAPGSMRAGTMTPDRRLRVDASGSGASPGSPAAWKTDSLDYGISAYPSQRTTAISTAATRIYAILCTWDVQTISSGPSASGPVIFSLFSVAMGNFLRVYQAGVSVIGTGATFGKGESKYLLFNPPLDVVLSGWSTAPNDLTMVIDNNTEQQLDTAMMVYHD